MIMLPVPLHGYVCACRVYTIRRLPCDGCVCCNGANNPASVEASCDQMSLFIGLCKI